MRSSLLTICLLCSTMVFSQDYFQQEVHYKISVELDDTLHRLYGNEELVYFNLSKEELSYIYMHIWPNAYRNKNTALAKQNYSNGNDWLHRDGEGIHGWIDSLDFHVNGAQVKWEYDEEYIDICKLILAEPLKPGEKCTITTPFTVQLPSGRISRLGHIGQSYQITQWYPKPAVFDKDGWHQMPYLSQGEFYSEYGTFDVSITVPDNYVVGATGDLQTESEVAFLNDLAASTQYKLEKYQGPFSGKWSKDKQKTPESSDSKKTIRFTQEDVHDFAWFADKRYLVLKGSFETPYEKRSVNSWTMFTPNNAQLWRKSIEYVNDGAYYYSLWNGDYPYNNVTAVDGTISAGGGMEYPNITVIGNSGDTLELETVIVHEVGHNWFYGQLGSNERVNGWMDEGLNTLNEIRYIETKYGSDLEASIVMLWLGLESLGHHHSADLGHQALASLGEDQAIATHSEEFNQINYGLTMYQKTGLVFHYLKSYLGDEKFDKAMLSYYADWEFRHPGPDDLRRSLEATTGEDLSWFFEGLIETGNRIDYKLCRASKLIKSGTRVKVKSVGSVDGPIPVSIMKNDSIVETQWLATGERKGTIDFRSNGDYARIDPTHQIPELNRKNNHSKTFGLFKKIEPLEMKFLIGIKDDRKSHMYWSPVIAGNVSDKLMIGAAFHNLGGPPTRYGYLVAPMYSFGRRMVSGSGEFFKLGYPDKGIKLNRLGVSVKSYKHDTIYSGNDSYYATVSPYWFAKLGSRSNHASKCAHTLRFQTLYRYDQFGPSHIEHGGAYLEYVNRFNHPDHIVKTIVRPDFISNLNNSDQMMRGTIESNYSFRYLRGKKKRWIHLRAFYGHYFQADFNAGIGDGEHFSGYQYSMSLSGMDGAQDLYTEQYFLGRNTVSGFTSQIRQENMGGFRSTAFFGTTSSWMASTNLTLEIPYIPRFFVAYADFGIFNNGVTNQEAINVGLGVRLKDYLGLYCPIWMSKELNESFGNSRYREKIRLTIKFNLAQESINLNSIL